MDDWLLDAELAAHLGYERREVASRNSGNSRYGRISKNVQTGIGPVGVDVPRDRAGPADGVVGWIRVEQLGIWQVTSARLPGAVAAR